MKKVCLVSSVVYFVEWFLLDQIAQLSKQYDVTVVVQTNDPDLLARHGVRARLVNAPIDRPIKPLKDWHALLFLVRLFRRNEFDLIHSTGPKAGLLAMLAGFIARVPVRIHTFTGQVWGTRAGLARSVLKSADRVIALAATHVLADSFSQRDFLLRERVVSRSKSSVLAHGSLSGVNLTKFRPDAARRSRVRKQFAIPEETLVFLYMARLTRDKGALVMAEGFRGLCAAGDTSSHLLVVGPDEEDLRPRMAQICAPCIDRVHFDDYTDVPEDFMAAADALCLPSYREGFGTVLIDAAAVGIPAIASRIYGSEEAVQEDVTGLLHEAGNSEDLAQKMRSLALDPTLRQRLGASARARAQRCFAEADVTAAVLRFYAQCMQAADSTSS